MKLKHNLNEAGFSLIESIFIIVILSVLVSISVLVYSGLQSKLTADLVSVDLKTIRATARTYYMKNLTFPAALNTLVVDGYLDESPHDKFAPSLDYCFTSAPNLFQIWSRGPNGIDDGGGADDILLTFGP